MMNSIFTNSGLPLGVPTIPEQADFVIENGVKFWHKHLSNISDKASIGWGTVVHAGVHIHDKVHISKNCQIEAMAFLPNGVILQDKLFLPTTRSWTRLVLRGNRLKL